MDQRAAQRHVRHDADRVERIELQDAARIDRIGIADQRLDLGDRKPARARLQRRQRLGTAHGHRPRRAVERAGPVEIAQATDAKRLRLAFAEASEQALQPARGDRRRAAPALGAGDDYFAG
ncbi:MAG: hypothetical protein P0Y66_03580 [Candidatus Kaistia colombiensis]|nr:MAG: hypothetical protein P0Y66_03580 [Kaistia sp.]